MLSGIENKKMDFMDGNSMRLKSGVSLIVVLLFMLIATIAATATYKWITSESRSSGARMIQREAFQSAEAGIEATRAWMTFHGNDVGALIKKYMDGNNQPIKIDGQMAEFKRGGQSYDVWLTGVNTDATTYKLKIVSKGKSRNGVASYTEAAILKVDGLYKVKIPAKKTSGNFNFNYNYFGASMENHGNMNSTSILVNGNWKGNPNTVQTTFVVTGNAELSGNNLHIGETACIGGDLSSNNGFTGRDLYVGKNANSFTARLQGNAYFDGSVVMGTQANPGFNIDGNVFLKGSMRTSQNEFSPIIHGNLCLDENAILLSSGTNNQFVVKKNVWLPGPFNVAFGNFNWSTGATTIEDNNGIDALYDRIVFVDSAGTAYIKYGKPSRDYHTLHNKSFKENKEWTKNCDKVNANYNQAVCAQWDAVGFGGNWSDQWSYWSDANYQPYAWERAEADDKYYIYYTEAGKKDVDFKRYDRKDLRQVRTGHAGPGHIGPGPIGPAGHTFKNSEVGAYYVGGEYFYYQDLVTTGGGWMAPISYSLTPHYRGYHFDCLHNDKNNSCEDGSIAGSPYCKKVSTEGFRPFCSVPSWFSVKNGTLSTADPTNLDCGESIKTSCDSIWRKGNGCDGSAYKVDDVLKNSYDVFKDYASKPCAADIKDWDNDVVKDMNSCYETLKGSDNLFNGYLVVSVKANNKVDPPGTLKGKFIIIFENDPGQNAFPPTEEGSYVFLYLRNGGSAELQPTGAGLYNYFIFTDKDVSKFLFNNTATLSGSIYAKAENCAKVKDMTIDNMVMNQELLNDLVSNGVLCATDQSDCGAVVTIGDPETTEIIHSTTTEVFGTTDTYYISSAPQLRISVESQYKNSESESALADAEALGGSFIVLPRVVYMSKDPKGALNDYYGVVPLNSKSAATGKTIACNDATISARANSSKLYDPSTDTMLPEGYFICNVTATVGGNTSTVPFYLVVKGTLNGAPEVNFKEPVVELAQGNSTTPKLVLDAEAAQPYKVKFTIPTSLNTGWDVSPIDGVTTCVNGVCEATIPTTQKELAVLTVTNSSATSGSVTLTITECDACHPGTQKVETIFVAASADVELHNLTEYCAAAAGNCPAGSDLAKQANTSEWPDCPESGTWVSVNSTSATPCKTLVTNHRWLCNIDGGINLVAGTAPSGCQVVIPTTNNSYTSPLAAGQTHYLYAGLKATAMKFYAGFAGDIDEGAQKTIHVEVLDNNGNLRELNCTYANFKNNENNCAIDVYRGSKVTLSLPDNPSDFNRWKCEAGTDCAGLTNLNQGVVSFNITGVNKVYAHFNEKDKHCFFDEFTRSTLGCGATISKNEYCVVSCADGATCNTEAKWRLLEGNLTDLYLDTYDKKIKIKESVNRHKKESEISRVTLLSNAVAGLYGTLKAQFKISKQKKNNSGAAMAVVKNTGFVLRSTTDLSDYLMLNIYLDDNNNVNARLCIKDSDVCRESPLYKDYATAYANDGSIVLASATLKGLGGAEDTLVVSVIPSPWSSTTYTTTFILNNSNLPGVENLKTYGTHESVGFRLSDPNVELYGIGWYSEDYNSECWDTYPTVKCSFKANYMGGIVPKDSAVAPWVGMSAWFDQGYGRCKPRYYYNGTVSADLICSGAALTDDESFRDCGKEYRFGTAGSHGSDNRIAKAGVSDCGLTYQQNQWASANADCGPFWVGQYNSCTHAYTFEYVGQNDAGGEYWNIGDAGLANLRDATLKIILDNAAKDEIEISLFSQYNFEDYYYGNEAKYSQTFKTKGNGEVSIDVGTLSDAEGFDPERVKGVYIRNLTTGSVARVTSVTSTCPNVLGIDACHAEYNTSSGKWRIQGMINNAARAGEIRVTAGGSASTSGLDPASPLVCGSSKDNPCNLSGSGKKQPVVFEWLDDPFANNMGKNYTFDISVTANDNASTVVSCTTDPYEISSIRAECSLKKTSVVAGDGIPVVEYSLFGCPDNKCSYEIYVDGQGTIAQNAQTGDFTTLNSSPNVLNAATSPLELSTYTVKMRSKDAKRPFTEVTCGEFSVTSMTQQQSEIQSTCRFDNSSITLGQNTIFRSSNFTGTAQSATVRLLDPDGNEIASNGSFWTGGNYDVWNIKPTKVGAEQEYILLVNGGVSCKAKITVTGPSATCSYEKTTLTQGEKLKLQVSSIAPSNSSVKFEVVQAVGTTDSTSKYLENSYWTNNTYNGEYEMNVIGTYTYKVKIQDAVVCPAQTITVTGLTPSVTCPTAKQVFEVGKTASFKVSSLTNCGGGCNYSLDPESGTNITYVDDGSYTSKDTPISWTAPLATADSVKYTLTVTNKDDSKLKGTCNITVKYEEESNMCKCSQYCGSECGNIITGDYGDTAIDGCYFVSDASRISATGLCNAGNYIKINGTEVPSSEIKCNEDNGKFQPCWDNSASCASALENYSKADGGWYIYIKAGWASLKGSGYDPCEEIVSPSISNCPTTYAGVGGTAKISPAGSGCANKDGCTYAIKKSGTIIQEGTWRSGEISFTDNSAETGDNSYTFEVNNSASSASHTCVVNYKDGAVITAYDQSVTVENGKCFYILYSGSGYIRCSHAWQNNACTVKVTYNNASTSWNENNCNNSNGNALQVNSFDPDKAACVNVTGASDVSCRITNWGN